MSCLSANAGTAGIYERLYGQSIATIYGTSCMQTLLSGCLGTTSTFNMTFVSGRAHECTITQKPEDSPELQGVTSTEALPDQ